MKYLILIFFLAGCAYRPTNSNILIQEDPLLTNSDNFRTSYSLSENNCQIIWSTFGARKSKDYYLELRYGTSDQCPSFEKQMPLHQALLTKIFADQDNKKIKSLTTSSFYLMDPSYSWNIKVVQAAVNNKHWHDFTKNYPNHASGKSVNSIFVDIANQTNAYSPLKKLFQQFHQKIHLVSVEKVFTQKSEKFPFKHLLQSSTLAYPRSLLYDAGQLYYSVTSY